MKMMKMRPDASAFGRDLGRISPSVTILGVEVTSATSVNERPPILRTKRWIVLRNPVLVHLEFDEVRSGMNLPSASRTMTSVLT